MLRLCSLGVRSDAPWKHLRKVTVDPMRDHVRQAVLGSVVLVGDPDRSVVCAWTFICIFYCFL